MLHPYRRLLTSTTIYLVGTLGASVVSAQTAAPPPASVPSVVAPPAQVPAAVAPPPGYVIGFDDALTVTFWDDAKMGGEVVVRPDGKISLPLLNEIQAAGLTPEELRRAVVEAARKWVATPTVEVRVREIKSRRVFITGMVQKPDSYPLTGPITVSQLITLAGGLQEFAKSKEIIIVRTEKGQPVSFKFNYNDFSRGRNLRQNIQLMPGDQVIVP